MNLEDFNTSKWRLVSLEAYEPLPGNNPLEWAVEFNASGEFAVLAKRMNVEQLEAQLGGPIENIGAPEDADRIGLIL